MIRIGIDASGGDNGENTGLSSMFLNSSLNQNSDFSGQDDVLNDVSKVSKNDTSDSSCELPAWLTKKSN